MVFKQKFSLSSKSHGCCSRIEILQEPQLVSQLAGIHAGLQKESRKNFVVVSSIMGSKSVSTTRLC